MSVPVASRPGRPDGSGPTVSLLVCEDSRKPKDGRNNQILRHHMETQKEGKDLGGFTG